MGKTVFVTGASSGIGQSVVQKFLAEGWNVVATMRAPEKSQLGQNSSLLLLPIDVTKPAQIAAAYQAAIERFGVIDALVNNAGLGVLGPVEMLQRTDIEQQFAVNVFGLIQVTQQFLPHFREQKSGVIINISSMYGKISMPYFGIYAATKHAVEALSESLQQEVYDFGIQVKIIEPGSIRTNFMDNAKMVGLDSESVYSPQYHQFMKSIAKGSKGGADPSQVADAVWRAASTNGFSTRFRTDQTGRLLLLLHAMLPPKYYAKLLRKVIR